MKKSQAAIEFLMSYGWALLILILVTTGLFALGVFKSPEFKSLCRIGAPFSCIDIVVQDSQSTNPNYISNITLRTSNIATLSISSFRKIQGKCTNAVLLTNPIKSDGNNYIGLKCPAGNKNDKEMAEIDLAYSLAKINKVHTTTLSFTAYREHGETSSPNLVLDMSFDTNSSGFTQDYSGFGNNGIINYEGTNLTWQGNSCARGGCYNFSSAGTNANISIPFTQSLNFTNRSFSVGFWVNTMTNTRDQRIINGDTTSSGAESYGVELRGSATEGVRFLVRNSAGQNLVDIRGPEIPQNQWIYVAAVWNGSRGILYVDGSVSAISPVSTNAYAAVNNPRNPLLVGLLVAQTRRLNGTLDELKIWDRALTQAEIQNAMIL